MKKIIASASICLIFCIALIIFLCISRKLSNILFGSFLLLSESLALKNQLLSAPFSLSSGAGAGSPLSGLSCGRHLTCLQFGSISIIKVKFSPMGIRRALPCPVWCPRPQLPSGHLRGGLFILSLPSSGVISSVRVIFCLFSSGAAELLPEFLAQPAKQTAQPVVRIAITFKIDFFIKQVCIILKTLFICLKKICANDILKA